MTKRDDTFYLEGIQEHIAAIESYLPASREEFLADEMVQDAILTRLFALGEEISQLSESLSEKYPELQWHQIIGLRNRIAHSYFEVDKDVIWQTLTDGSLAELRSIVDNLG